MQPGLERRLVTAALVLGMFLGAVEATAVGTAMPTAIAELGGMARYSWVFSVYLLTSTTTVPLFGKLTDLYGRRRIYLISVAIFLAGSALSGAATSMQQLIVFRAIQGIGAGGVMPVAVTIIGDIYPLRERGRVQGVFSAVWATASLLGPALGGLVTDVFSWRWIFYLNVPFGIVSVVMLLANLREEPAHRKHKLDILGTVSLTAAVTLLLVALLEGSDAWGWSSPLTISLLAAAAGLSALFIWQQRRAEEPTLPLELFSNRIIAAASVGSVVLGVLLFGASAFVPMFVQGVLGGTAVDAGLVLAPMTIGWPITSALAGMLMMRIGYRPLIVAGWVVALIGTGMLARVDPETTRADAMLAMLVIGLGLGLTSTPYLVAVQNAVPRSLRGVATSSSQFFRTIGGAIGIAALGALLNARLHRVAGAAADANMAMDVELRGRMDPAALHTLVRGLREGLGNVYVAFFVLTLLSLVAAFGFPGGTAESHAHPGDGRPQELDL